MQFPFPFILSQVALVVGVVLYLACVLLMRFRPWLPCALGWLIIIGPASIWPHYIPLAFLMTGIIGGGICSVFGACFVFFPAERQRSWFLAYMTLIPLSVICMAFTIGYWTYWALQHKIHPNIPMYVMVIGALSPSLAAFLMWLLKKAQHLN